MATHSSALAWRIPWTEEPGGLWSTGLQRVGYNSSALAHTCALTITNKRTTRVKSVFKVGAMQI